MDFHELRSEVSTVQKFVRTEIRRQKTVQLEPLIMINRILDWFILETNQNNNQFKKVERVQNL